MSTGKVLTSLVAGIAAGAVLGILFAPDKGTETRKKISKKGTDFADNLKEKFNDFVDSVSDNFSYAKDEAGELYENGRQKVSNVKAEVSKSLS